MQQCFLGLCSVSTCHAGSLPVDLLRDAAVVGIHAGPRHLFKAVFRVAEIARMDS